MVKDDVTFRGYSPAVLRYAWDKVKNPKDWKGSICALVPADVLDVVCAAIEYKTGNVPAVFVVDLECNEFLVVSRRPT